MRVVNNSHVHQKAQWRRYLAAMRDQHWALLLGCTLLFCGACRKDKDNTAPTVLILSPVAGSTVAVPDTITIGVHVEDDGLVEQLTVFLADANGTPVGPTVQVAVNSSSAHLAVDLPIISERMETGEYVITARASDGENDGRSFLDLNIQAAPLRVRSVFVVPAGGTPGPVTILRIDSTGTATAWTTVAELGGACIDLDHLLVAGTTSLPLSRVNVSSGSSSTLLANNSIPGSTITYFHGLTIDPTDGRAYIGTLDGSVRGFNAQGHGAFTATCPTGSYSEHTVVVGDLVVSATHDPVLGTRALANFAYSSGVLLTQFPLDLEPIGLFDHGNEHVLVFGNRNGAGVIQERNVQAGAVYEMQVFAGDPIRAVAKLDEQTFVIARSTDLVRFSYANNGFASLLPGTTADALVHDRASGSVLAGVGDQLITVDPNTGAQLDVRTIPFDIGGVLLQMNR